LIIIILSRKFNALSVSYASSLRNQIIKMIKIIRSDDNSSTI